MAVGVKREADNTNQQATSKRAATSATSPGDYRTLVCAVRGLLGQVCAVTIRANASIHQLKQLVHCENASQLTGVTATTLSVSSTNDHVRGWARLSDNGAMISRGESCTGTLLLPTKRVGDYFPADIPPFDSGVVHVVVDVVTNDSASSQVTEIGAIVLPDDKPVPHEDNDMESERYGRVREALGLTACWAMDGTDFSKKHDYQGAKWLKYSRWYQGEYSRVYIGDKTTWRELFVACDQVIEKNEGPVASRFVEGFSRSGSTLELEIGT